MPASTSAEDHTDRGARHFEFVQRARRERVELRAVRHPCRPDELLFLHAGRLQAAEQRVDLCVALRECVSLAIDQDDVAMVAKPPVLRAHLAPLRHGQRVRDVDLAVPASVGRRLVEHRCREQELWRPARPLLCNREPRIVLVGRSDDHAQRAFRIAEHVVVDGPTARRRELERRVVRGDTTRGGE